MSGNIGIGVISCDNGRMVTNSTIETLLNRRSIRKFADEPIDDDTIATLETVAQHAASSQYLNDWSAVRITDPDPKARLAAIAKQPYIAEAPLLYVFILDEHRNAAIAKAKGAPAGKSRWTRATGSRRRRTMPCWPCMPWRRRRIRWDWAA